MTEDHALMLALFSHFEADTFGPLDGDSLFALGISSGGYMTSRMAVSYPGRFRRLAIASAGYATCGGPWCFLPDSVPSDHPPTIFLHGGRDPAAPVSLARRYAHLLRAAGVEAPLVVDPTRGHEWIPDAVRLVPAFFRAAFSSARDRTPDASRGTLAR